MTSVTTDSDTTEQIAVGQCPDHGYVTGDEVTFNFPEPAQCSCGSTLTAVTLEDRDRVETLRGN